jgi:deazaflavin-dependent oxidoreductase (nitroreductase family)
MRSREHAPRRALRLILRAPLPLYRAGLGVLLGHRLVYLAHRGRVSGRRRETVLEVVSYSPGEVVVVSGWGARADWYRNLQAAPPLEVRVGARRFAHPQRRFLDAAEGEALLREYRRRHGLAWRQLSRVLQLPQDPGPQDWPDLVAALPAVALHDGPDEPGPPDGGARP